MSEVPLHTHLLKGSIYLLQQSRFFLLEKHPELSSQVEIEYPQQSDSCCADIRVGSCKGFLDVVDEWLDVQAVGREGGKKGGREEGGEGGREGEGDITSLATKSS